MAAVRLMAASDPSKRAGTGLARQIELGEFAAPLFDSMLDTLEHLDSPGRDSREFLQVLRQAIQLRRIQLPALPEPAAQLPRILSDPELDRDELARVIQVDPALAAKVVGAANSAMYSGSMRPGTCTRIRGTMWVTSEGTGSIHP